MTTINKLYSYRNGNVNVAIYSDGTKIRECNEEKQILEFPESIDVKITNYCPIGCEFCHEKSTVKGIHGNLIELAEKIPTGLLPNGIEFAIGGGDPMSHPEIFLLLDFLRSSGQIANMTMNQMSLRKYWNRLKYLLEEKYIRAMGISINGDDFSIVNKMMDSGQVVFHVISGVHDISTIDRLKEQYGNPKILVLGYKAFGFGIDYLSADVVKNIYQWKIQIPKYLGNVHLSFDNLAIEQLELKKWFTDEEWNKIYMGDDFTSSMYIDAVSGEYAPTSRSLQRTSWHDADMIAYFRKGKYYVD